jgi:hypothetical protein
MWALCHRDEHDRIQLLPGPIAEGWEGVPFADKDQTACPKCGSANLDRT